MQKMPKITIPYPLIGILIFAAFAYFPILQNGFVSWDDGLYIIENEVIKAPPFSNLREIFTTKINHFNVPLTLLSFQIDYYFFGLNGKFYHFTNLLLHLANTVLIFFFFKKLTQNQTTSLLIALLFSLHTMNVESVAWATERKDLLYTVLMLGSLLAYQKFNLENKILPYIFAILLFISSLLAKPQALFYPFLLILVDFWYEKKWYDFRNLLNKAPFFLVSLLCGLYLLQSVGTTVNPALAQFSLFDRFLFSTYQVWLYVWKFFLPVRLNIAYNFPEKHGGWFDWDVYVVPFVLVGILVFLWKYYSNKKVLIFAILFYLINIFIVLHLVTINTFLAYERFNYVAYLGFFLILSTFLQNLLQKNTNYYYIIGIYVLFISILTFQRCKIWSGDEILFTDALSKEPNSLIYVNRGNYYATNRQFEKALDDFNQSLRLNPEHGRAYFLRGFTLFNLGNYPQAITDFLKALDRTGDLDPENLPEAVHNIGSCYYNLQQYEKALPYYTKAIELNPAHQPAYAFRGNVLAHFGQYEAALQDYRKALELNPQDQQTYNQLQGLQTMLRQKGQ